MSTSSFLNLAQILGRRELHVMEALKQFGFDLRVASPGIVQSFDPVKQTVTVQLVMRENIKDNVPDGSGNFIPVSTPTPIPLLADVPVVMLRGGGFCVTVPVTAGDECMVVFQDNCFNAWWSNGAGTGQPAQLQNEEEQRRHDLSDAIAILGPWSQPRKLVSYSTTALQVRSDDGTVEISVSAGQITITPDSGTTLFKIIAGEIDLNATLVKINGQNFHSHVHSGVTTGGGVTGPVTP